MRSHMARYARCGWSVSRSFGSWGCLTRRSQLVSSTLALAILLGMTVLAGAQDVNPNIEPRPTPTPNAAPIVPNDPAASFPGVTTDPGLKVNHGKPIQV